LLPPAETYALPRPQIDLTKPGDDHRSLTLTNGCRDGVCRNLPRERALRVAKRNGAGRSRAVRIR
jgi:hypothetical protein